MYNTGVEAIFAGLLSACLAQILKVLIFIVCHKKINFKIFTTTGGMPSSHSAGVVALTTSVGLIEGFNSIAFAISLGFSLVVIQDAQGLRRAAGKTAATLNRLIGEWNMHNSEQTKPYEVLMGMLLGIVISIFVHYELPQIWNPEFFINTLSACSF